jgi:4-amino-4-deoxy-L-arabinose transferase-like glycosyltransferase
MLVIDRKYLPDLKWLAAALALLVVFLIGLDRSLLFDVDEGAFTEATREMLVSGDWGHTTLNGLDRFDKPIGVYWLQALSASIFGVNEFAFRLPSALSGWIASLALARFAFFQWGRRAAITAAIISATSLGPWAIARTATADALLGLFFVLIFLDLWRALSSEGKLHARCVALWVALGILVKGPVALLLPLGTMILYGIFVPESRLLVKKFMLDWASWMILVAVSLPWYLYAYLRHGQTFVEGFFLKHNVERFMGSMEGHSGHWAYFLIALPLLWLPWSGLFFRALFHIRLQWHQAFFRYCWLWFAFVFCFFSVANTKLPHYLLYAEPAMCLILTYSSLDAKKSWWLAGTLAVLGLSVMLLLPSYLQSHPDLLADAYYKALMVSSEKSDMKVWLFAFPLIIYLGSVLRYLFRNSEAVMEFSALSLGVIYFALLQAFILSLVVLPWWSQTLQSPIKGLAQKHQADNSSIVQWGVHLPSFATYRQHESPRREPVPGEMALVKNMKPYWPSDWKVIDVAGPLSIVKSPD